MPYKIRSNSDQNPITVAKYNLTLTQMLIYKETVAKGVKAVDIIKPTQ